MTKPGLIAEQSLAELVWDLLDADSALDEHAKYAVIGALKATMRYASKLTAQRLRSNARILRARSLSSLWVLI